MKKWLSLILVTLMIPTLCACGTTPSTSQVDAQSSAQPAEPVSTPDERNLSSTTENSNELTDEEWERVQAIFTEYVGKEIEKKPVYCGEWREGRQYKTENYAYGQYLINMDNDGYVHLVVWVQDKAGSEGRTVMYNRLEDENAPVMGAIDDGMIHLVYGQSGEYGTEKESGTIWYKVPAGTYEVVSESKHSTVFVVSDADSNDERSADWLTEQGETVIIVVEDNTHIELGGNSRVVLDIKN